MSDDEWQFPAPMEDPEARPAGRNRHDTGGARLVPDGDFIEGEMKDDERKDPPSCPFSH